MGLVIIAALLAVFGAPLWHRHGHAYDHRRGLSHAGHEHPAAPAPDDHDQAPQDHDDCAICLLLHAPIGDGLNEPTLFVPPARPIHPRWLGAERWAVLWVGRDRASRGPPAC